MSLYFIFVSLTVPFLCYSASARNNEIVKEDNRINLASRSTCPVGGGYETCDGGAGLLSVSYNGDVNCNGLLTKSATNSAPSVSFPGADEPKYYTLVMVDPDAPSPTNPTMKHWLHWIVSDIRGVDIAQGTVSGSQVQDYSGPEPPKGVHRYQFLLFEQPNGNLNANPPNSRGGFDPESFAHANNLCLVATFQFKVNGDA